LDQQIQHINICIDKECNKPNPDYKYIDQQQERLDDLNKQYSEAVEKANQHGLTVIQTVGGIVLSGIALVVGGKTYKKLK